MPPLAVDLSPALAQIVLDACVKQGELSDAEIEKLLRLGAMIHDALRNNQRVEARLTVTIDA